MRALLNSLGFALWWSTAIILATGVALVGYRLASTVKSSRAPTTELVVPRFSQLELEPSRSASADARHTSAQSDIVAARAAGRYSPQEAGKQTKVLFQLAAQNQQYGQAVEYGKQLADQGALAPSDLTILAQLYYVQKDCKNAVIWADKSIAAYKKAGEMPKETPYQFKLQCASDSGDMASMESPLVELIKLTNKTAYWNDLLRIERQDERDDHNLLMIYRVMYNTRSMKEGSDYIEMAQLLGDAALPGEAATVLNKAMTGGLIKPEQQERTGRLLKALQDRADADKKGLPQQEAEANKSSADELWAKLGEVYYGFADYQGASDALVQALRKEQAPRADEVYVYLGLADVHLGNIEAAKESFARLKLVPNLSPRILNLWLLYASTLGAADASPAPPSAARSLGAIAALPDDGTTISAARTPEAPRWAEGTQYVAVPHPRPISLPGQEILVTEFFSYASMASNQFQPLIHQLVQSLPPNAVVDHVPVSFNPSNVWAMFQLAYVTAQTLGVGDEIHDATFGAVWSTDELAISERSGAARSRMPTLEDAALFYQKKAGVPLAQFLQASKSFSVASRLRHDESLLLDYGIDRIPTIVVNGKYRVTVQSAGSPERMIELVDWLVAKESGTSTHAQTVSAETAGL